MFLEWIKTCPLFKFFVMRWIVYTHRPTGVLVVQGNGASPSCQRPEVWHWLDPVQIFLLVPAMWRICDWCIPSLCYGFEFTLKCNSLPQVAITLTIILFLIAVKFAWCVQPLQEWIISHYWPHRVQENWKELNRRYLHSSFRPNV